MAGLGGAAMSDDPVEQFRHAIEQRGLPTPDPILADGKLHHYATNGTRDDDAGWYVLHTDGIPAGAFGCHRAHVDERWCAKSVTTMTDQERRAHRARIASIKRQRDAAKHQRQAEAAATARHLWEQARPATAEHPYLLRKRVQSHGVKYMMLEDQAVLLIPIMRESTLMSLELIDEAGDKQFLPGGEVKGGSFTIGDLTDAETILEAEGFATAASLHEATGFPVVVAFFAGNLLPVAKHLRQRFPTAQIVLAGDNDVRKPGEKIKNTGLVDATAAAEAIQGLLAIPTLDGQKCDWNDVHVQQGLEAVTQAIASALTTHASAATPAHGANGTRTRTPKATHGQTDTTPDRVPSSGGRGRFRIEDDRIVRVHITKDGPVTIPLCNFVARVTEEVALDDGAETTRAFLMEGALHTGVPLPPPSACPSPNSPR